MSLTCSKTSNGLPRVTKAQALVEQASHDCSQEGLCSGFSFSPTRLLLGPWAPLALITHSPLHLPCSSSHMAPPHGELWLLPGSLLYSSKLYVLTGPAQRLTLPSRTLPGRVRLCYPFSLFSPQPAYFSLGATLRCFSC